MVTHIRQDAFIKYAMPWTFENDERVITYEDRKNFWVQKTAGVYSILLLFSKSYLLKKKKSYLLLLWTWNKKKCLRHCVMGLCVVFLCVSGKGYLLFLCQVFLFSCILFTVCVSLSITHFFKKLAFCLVWFFTWCYLYYSCVTAFEIFKVPILIWKKKFVLKKVSVTHH